MNELPIEPPEQPVHRCPCCGLEDPDSIVIDPVTNQVLGCNFCLDITPSWKYFEDY